MSGVLGRIMRTIPFVFAVLILGCGVPAVPTPSPAPDSSYCDAMCAHIGPSGLNCPEGQAVYDSAVAGPRGVANESCTDFCKKEEAVGVWENPKCVMVVATCADIEPARTKLCPPFTIIP